MKIAGFIAPTAICRHAGNDPDCSKNGGGYAAYETRRRADDDVDGRYSSKSSDSPDADNFEVVEALPVGLHLVMKVLYPNCKKCAYEGNKIMVFLNTDLRDAIKWRKIDPHFRATPKVGTRNAKEAPSPAARFPASPEGLEDALNYARSKK